MEWPYLLTNLKTTPDLPPERIQITVEEGIYTPFKKTEKQSLRGVLILARNVLKSDEQLETADKEKPHVRQ